MGKTNEAEIEKALSVVCQGLSTPVSKQCEKLVVKYTEKIIEMFVNDYTPEMVCSELSLCVNNDINTNSIDEIVIRDSSVQKETIGCEMCEFAMSIIDKHLTDEATIDKVERIVQFMCSYLPGTIADKCEEFVDQCGQEDNCRQCQQQEMCLGTELLVRHPIPCHVVWNYRNVQENCLENSLC